MILFALLSGNIILINMKNWIIGIFIGSVALGAGLTIDFTETQKIDTEVSLLDVNKIEYIKEYEKGDFTYMKHYYIAPSGEKGTEIHITKKENYKTYKKVIVTGVQSKNSYDWELIKDDTPSIATSTK